MEGGAVSMKWERPQQTGALDLAFGGKMGKLLPSMKDIPVEFHSFNNPWTRLVGTWFAVGLSNPKFYPKPEIDEFEALGHVKAILVSFEPKHEHKQAACAWLMSLWFEKVEWDGGSATGLHPKTAPASADHTSRDANAKR